MPNGMVNNYNSCILNKSRYIKWFACLTLIIFSSSRPEHLDYRHIASILAKNSTFSTDNLGNIYLIRPDFSIDKYDRDGRFLLSNNFKLLGPLHTLDAGNPMELYAFYREQNVLGLYDNQLSLRARIDLNRTGSNAISCLARSYDNAIWVFDQQDLQLKKYSKSLDLLLQSGNIRSLTGIAPQPSMLIDDGEHVLLADQEHGILVFDIYANFVKTIPLLHPYIQSEQKSYLLSGTGNAVICDARTLQETELSVGTDLKNVHVRREKNRLYIHQRDTLFIMGN